jgi:hypothetical protein
MGTVADNNGVSAMDLGSIIDFDRYSEVMEQGRYVGRLDMGSALISKVIHPELGAVLLISTDGGKAALIAGVMLQ